ncbi:MAG: hypothetical protein OXG55_04525, partial [bacterium]|nr:hypothetical protein [bacterium]
MEANSVLEADSPPDAGSAAEAGSASEANSVLEAGNPPDAGSAPEAGSPQSGFPLRGLGGLRRHDTRRRGQPPAGSRYGGSAGCGDTTPGDA